MAYSEEELLEELKRVSDQHCNGEAPTWREFEEHGFCDPETISRRFDGSWNEAISELSLNPNEAGANEKDKSYYKEAIKKVSVKYCEGRAPTAQEVRKYGECDPDTIVDRFGYNNLLQEMGYEVHKPVDEEPSRWSGVSGEDHPRWKGGNNSTPYYGSSWRKKREKCRKRDNYQCIVCGDQENVHVHHITPVRYWDVDNEHEEMNHLRNLVCLCIQHHRKLEGELMGRSYESFIKLVNEKLE